MEADGAGEVQPECESTDNDETLCEEVDALPLGLATERADMRVFGRIDFGSFLVPAPFGTFACLGVTRALSFGAGEASGVDGRELDAVEVCSASRVGMAGGIVMVMNVSTSREFITFSRLICELSGNIAESDLEPEAAEEGITAGGYSAPITLPADEVDMIDVVRGRRGLIVGADPEVRPGREGEICSRVAGIEDAPAGEPTFTPLPFRPLASLGEPFATVASPPTSDLIVCAELIELNDIFLLRLLFKVRSESSER